MRLFTAVEFDEETKNKISLLQRELQNICPKGRWKHRDNFHLTVKFLGEVDERKLHELEGSLKAAAEQSHEFNIRINEIGFFGPPPIYRVLWLGLMGDLNKLGELYKNVENQLSKIGFPKEKRPYSPHVTIAQDIEISNSIEKLKEKVYRLKFETMKINKFVLVKSEQIKNKWIYTSIGEFKLGK